MSGVETGLENALACKEDNDNDEACEMRRVQSKWFRALRGAPWVSCFLSLPLSLLSCVHAHVPSSSCARPPTRFHCLIKWNFMAYAMSSWGESPRAGKQRERRAQAKNWNKAAMNFQAALRQNRAERERDTGERESAACPLCSLGLVSVPRQIKQTNKQTTRRQRQRARPRRRQTTWERSVREERKVAGKLWG